MEGGGPPTELDHLERELRGAAEDAAAAGVWLSTAMQSAWDLAPALFAIDGLADLLGERHRIIVNNWQAASVMDLVGRLLERTADLLGRVDFTPAALRADLDGPRLASPRVASAAEMLDHAADLLCDFAGLVHDNERRWRVVHARVETLLATGAA